MFVGAHEEGAGKLTLEDMVDAPGNILRSGADVWMSTRKDRHRPEAQGVTRAAGTTPDDGRNLAHLIMSIAYYP